MANREYVPDHSPQPSPQPSFVQPLPASPIISGSPVLTITEYPTQTRPKSESRAEVARLRDEYKQYVTDLLEWTRAQENLDVYQVNAFYSATHEWRYYWRNYLKICCVIFIQTAGLLILLFNEENVKEALSSGDTETDSGFKGMCARSGQMEVRLLAFSLILFLALRLSDQIASLADYGMYSWGARLKEKHFINWGWIAFGLCINYFTLFLSFVISGFVVYNGLYFIYFQIC